MAVTGDTQLGPTKMELISEIAQRALISSSKLAGTCRDVSMFARKGNESISFPKNTTLFAAENRASGASATIQDVDFSKDTLTLDKNYIVNWLVDSHDELESVLDVQKELIERAAREQARQVDADVIAALEAGGITTTTAGNISQDLVLEMRRILLKNKANSGDIWLAVSPKQEAELLKIQPFVGADQYGSAVVPSGVLGTIYGVKVVMSPELGDDAFYMYESEGCALGFHMRPQFDEVKRPEYGAGAMLQVLDQKYGVKELQLEVPGAFKADGITALAATESALIVKDNNI